VNHYDVKTKIELEADETSFNHILVVDGNGKINDKPLKKGSSFFIPANFGKYEISGECEIIVTNI
jgi:mannose-6-phosphate isomerase